MQLSLSRIRVAVEHKVLSPANLSTRVSVGNDTHTFDTFRNAHLRVEDRTVGREVHASDIIGGERCVLHLNPGFTIAKLIHNAGGVIGQHLIQSDVLGSLSHCRRGANQ